MVDVKEEWRIIDEFPKYAVSNTGKVKRIIGQKGHAAGRIMKERFNSSGYPAIRFCSRRKEKIRCVHRLVLDAFIGPKPRPELTCNHRDGIKTNNNVSNLEWCTRTENIQHAYANGLMHIGRGETHNCAKLKNGEVWLIRRLLAAGINQMKICKMFKVSNSTISLIKRNKRYVESECKEYPRTGPFKFKTGEIWLIRRLLSAGTKGRDIAKMFRVGPMTISCIKNGKTYSWLENKGVKPCSSTFV